MSAPAAKWGAGRSQEDFMYQDECLLVNYNDEVIGADNKCALCRAVYQQTFPQ